MSVRAKYVTEFTIKAGRIKGQRVIGEEYANDNQKLAIQQVKPLLVKFVKSRLKDQDCIVNVKVSYVETAHGLEMTFRV